MRRVFRVIDEKAVSNRLFTRGEYINDGGNYHLITFVDNEKQTVIAVPNAKEIEYGIVRSLTYHMTNLMPDREVHGLKSYVLKSIRRPVFGDLIEGDGKLLVVIGVLQNVAHTVQKGLANTYSTNSLLGEMSVPIVQIYIERLYEIIPTDNDPPL